MPTEGGDHLAIVCAGVVFLECCGQVTSENLTNWADSVGGQRGQEGVRKLLH